MTPSMRRRALRHRLDLVRNLVERDFATTYRRSMLGWLWSLLLPLAQLGVLVAVFQYVVPLDIPRYPAFVMSGLLPWTWFSGCLTAACSLFVASRDLVRRPNFSPSTLVVVSMLSSFTSYLVAVPILIGVVWCYGRPPAPSLGWVPVLAVIQGLLIVGLGLAVATLNVFYRDVQHIVAVGIMLAFYLTPVFYDVPSDPGPARLLYLANPMAGLIHGYRSVFLEGAAPAAGPTLVAAMVSAAVAAGGYLLYRRALPDVVDLV